MIQIYIWIKCGLRNEKQKVRNTICSFLQGKSLFSRKL